jgi:hypothetical protein
MISELIVIFVRMSAMTRSSDLSYTLQVRDGKSEDTTEIIPIVHLHCRFSGGLAPLPET